MQAAFESIRAVDSVRSIKLDNNCIRASEKVFEVLLSVNFMLSSTSPNCARLQVGLH